MDSPAFWQKLDDLVSKNGYVVERPKGSAHPRYPEYIYPVDYGYINNTKSSDGAEMDAWIGNDENKEVTGLLITADALKNDSEIKVLVGCSKDEMQAALASSDRGDMSALLVERAV